MNHMRKILAFFCAITLVMSMSAFASEAPDTAGETRILVLETSDIHGWIMDASSGAESTFQYRGAYLAHIVNEARASDAYDDVLLLDGGDLYQGCPVSNLLTGAPVRAFVDAMDYDAVALGNHEFDWGVEAYCADPDGTVPAYELGDFSGDPDIPILSSEIYRAETGERVPFTQDHVIVEKAGHRIALVGYIPDYSGQIAKESIEAYTIDGSLNRLIERVRAINGTEAPDVTIVVAHEEPTRVAAALDPADVQLVTGGHVHAGRSGISDSGVPYIQGNSEAKGYAAAVIIIGGDGSVRVEEPAHFDITRDRKALFDTVENASLLDETVLSICRTAWDEVQDDMSEVIGYDMRSVSDNGASAAGNFFTGLMLRETAPEGVVAAFYNSGGIRAALTIPSGAETRDVTAGDIYAIAPFGNSWFVFELTGAELAKQLADCIVHKDNGDQMSGLTFEYLATGMDIEIVSITLDDGTEVDVHDDETLYRVCTSSYSATREGSVFEDKEPLFPEAEAPIDNLTMIALLREEAKMNDGRIDVDTTGRGVCLNKDEASGETSGESSGGTL